MKTRFTIAAAGLACALGLAACTSTPGPVQPAVGSKAPGVLVIDPALAPYLDVPNGEQNYRFNDLGFLEYNTIVRNKGARPMALAIRTSTFDEAGALLEEQDPIRFFVDPSAEKPLQVAANAKKARTMRIQIHPAR